MLQEIRFLLVELGLSVLGMISGWSACVLPADRFNWGFWVLASMEQRLLCSHGGNHANNFLPFFYNGKIPNGIGMKQEKLKR